MTREKIEACLRIFALPAAPDPETLRRRYRELIKLYHPDHNPDRVLQSTLKVQELNQAYRTLLDSLKGSGGAGIAAGGSADALRSQANSLLRQSDQILAQAVATGWLKRPPRHRRSLQLRARAAELAARLQEAELLLSDNPRIGFMCTLLRVFLRCTEVELLRPFAAALNATRYFQRLSRANGLLESGIRSFYLYQEAGRLGRLSSIPLATLGEAERQYRTLLWESREPLNTRLLQTRLELTHLFQARLQDPAMAVPWSGS